jgi:PhoH-like ATPase
MPLPESLRGQVLANEFVKLSHIEEVGVEEFAIYKKDVDQLQRLLIAPIIKSLPLSARNEEQLLSLELLYDDSIPLVALSGKAGTGKTLLALSIALRKVLWSYGKDSNEYEGVVLARSEVTMGKDPGAMPGSPAEKLLPYLGGYLDNLAIIGKAVSARGWHLSGNINENQSHKKASQRQNSNFQQRNQRSAVASSDWWNYVANLDKHAAAILDSGLVDIQMLSFIRGRSFSKKILIIDEAQNLTPAEIKTTITRAGEGTKVIVLGDTRQTDDPTLNEHNSGLSDLIQRFSGAEVFGHLKLLKSERSPLAEAATTLYED